MCAKRTGGTAGGAADVAAKVRPELRETAVTVGAAAGVTAGVTAATEEAVAALVAAGAACIVAAGAAAAGIGTRVPIAASKKATRQDTVMMGKSRLGGGRQTNQLFLLPDASCRRECPPSTSTVIAESCAESADESCALTSDGGIIQPLAVESIIARWTSIAYRGPPDTSFQAPLLCTGTVPATTGSHCGGQRNLKACELSDRRREMSVRTGSVSSKAPGEATTDSLGWP